MRENIGGYVLVVLASSASGSVLFPPRLIGDGHTRETYVGPPRLIGDLPDIDSLWSSCSVTVAVAVKCSFTLVPIHVSSRHVSAVQDYCSHVVVVQSTRHVLGYGMSVGEIYDATQVVD